jgi:AraC-like DNA-binding protein
MRVLFDTATIRPGDRLDRLRDAVGTAVVPVEIEHHTSPDRVAARAVGRRIGRLSVSTVNSTPMTLRRTVRLARADDEPSLVLEMQLAGRRTILQGDHRTELAPGDINVLDTTRPYMSVNRDGTHQHYLRIPRADLALPERTLTRVAGMRLGPDNPVAGLVSMYLTGLAGDFRIADGEVLEAPTVELVRAAITTQLNGKDPGREPLEDTLTMRLMQFVRANLTDRELSAATVARAHDISVRHLYTILGRSGIVLGEWIRAQRLEGCRRDLARTGPAAQTIAFIAHRWGFGDATHFGRTIREAYGMSPREWRALHQAGTP